MDNWIDRIRNHALIHYTEDGWWILVEYWPDSYIAEHYQGCASYEEAVITISNVLASMADWPYEIGA